MKRFLALFLVPPSVIAEWRATDPAERAATEAALREEWSAWKRAHGDALGEMGAAGQTRRVETSGTIDTHNEVMIYAFVQAESQEAASRIFDGHPHLKIPQARIDVMEAHDMTGL